MHPLKTIPLTPTQLKPHGTGAFAARNPRLPQASQPAGGRWLQTLLQLGPFSPSRWRGVSLNRALGLLSAVSLSAVLASAAQAQAPSATPKPPTLTPPPAAAPDKVTFATNWRAQAAHGGFYQALADGTYRRYGLDVTLVQGGPSVNNRPLLPAGRIDFLMTGNLLHSFDNVKNKVPTVVVAALFQKDPQALLAHPGQGFERFESLKSAPVTFIAKDSQYSWWAWLKAVHGFRDETLKPYNYNLAPFLSNKKSVQQGYSVAEPIYVQKQGGFKPVVHLLADHGFSTYSTLIETRKALAQAKPDLVQRFVDASILGWANYLKGPRNAANALMLKDNPDMTVEELEASVALMKSQGIVDSGDAQRLGIGAMQMARIQDFYAQMVKAGLYRPGEVDLTQVADLRFVNRGVGLPAGKSR
jgi:NitT/TauT family transport system substrate-binding protein